MGFRIIALLVILNYLTSYTLAIPFGTWGLYFQGGLNETCTEDADCTVRNSFCLETFPVGNETCQCPLQYFDYTSKPGNCPGPPFLSEVVSCLPVANNLGDKCGADLQCTSGRLGELSHCDEGTCRCLSTATYSELAFSCVELAMKLKDPCEEGHLGGQCRNVPHSRCSSDKCLCGVGKVESITSPGTCIPAAARIGESCSEEDVVCSALPNATCQGIPNNKTCQCVNATFIPSEDGTACLKKREKLGDRCTETLQCSTIDNSWCQHDSSFNKACHCMPGHVSSTAQQNTCIPIITDAGATCAESDQCAGLLGEHAECGGTPKKCVCKSTAVLISDYCYPIVSMGDECTFREQCQANDTVIPADKSLACDLDHTEQSMSIFKCSCPSNTHIEYQGICYLNSGYGLPCTSDEQCKASLNGTELVTCSGSNTSVCPAKYMLSGDKSRCILERVALGELCEEARQCSLVSASTNQYCEFESGRCKCKKGFSEQNNCGISNTTPTTTTTTSTNTTTSTTTSTERTTTPAAGSNIWASTTFVLMSFTILMLIKS